MSTVEPQFAKQPPCGDVHILGGDMYTCSQNAGHAEDHQGMTADRRSLTTWPRRRAYDPSFRCGWRIQRHRDDLLPMYYYNEVIIRRGEWRMQLPAQVFESMSDVDFADFVERRYRESAFEHLQRDLDTLAKQLLGELKATGGIAVVDGVATDEVQAALYRWDRARRDVEEET